MEEDLKQYKEVLQRSFNDQAYQAVFASFKFLQYNVEKEDVKKDAARDILNRRNIPFLIENPEIPTSDKKEMLMKAMTIATDDLKKNFETVLDFLLVESKKHVTLSELYNSLKTAKK